jgi:fibronectin-binding autotransporter adhesin
VTLDTTVLTLNNGTFSGVLNNGASSAGGLLKVSGGLLTLSGNNGYTGATSVNAGTLTLASGGTLASGTVGVSAGSDVEL